MQTKEELEEWYKQSDPWGYEVNPEDARRKQIILDALKPYLPFDKALDIGCGEGWVTKDLPAKEIYGTELSETASKRVPSRVRVITDIEGMFDLVTAMGVLYKQYDYQTMINQIMQHSCDIVLLCNIKDWEVPLPQKLLNAQVYEDEFEYREYIEKLRIIKW
jgi:hypothetical protein